MIPCPNPLLNLLLRVSILIGRVVSAATQWHPRAHIDLLKKAEIKFRALQTSVLGGRVSY